MRILEGERALLEALLASDAGARALRAVRADLRAGRLPVERVLRNPAPGRGAARAERLGLLAALASRGARRTKKLADLRLHPETLDALEAAVRAEGSVAERGRVREAKERIRAAKEELFARNVALVVSIATRYRPRHLTTSDLVQEGNLGLLHAIDKFDPRRGYRLSTYASWWIKQAVERAIADQAPTIRLPIHLVESRSRVTRARRALAREDRHAPTPRELAERTGLPIAKVELIERLTGEPASLDSPLGGEGGGTLVDLVANDTTALPDDEAADAQLRARAHELLVTLTPREQQVLHMRFGLLGAPERTLEEIGASLSLTRERIRQIEGGALRKLRSRCAGQAFHPDLGA
jgi:RNA polymerase primary sigma factor